MMPFDRFTETAQETPQRAFEVMQRYGHNQMDTEHVLLALIEQPQGVVSQILEMLKVNANALVEQLDSILRTSQQVSGFVGEAGQIPITPRVFQIITLADEEANQMKDEHISTEHMFLAIVSERDTLVAKLLEDAGITRDRVSDSLQQLRGGRT
jgi:ATP-dependent Clp protease ATP-binding subunit ClpC